MRLTFTLLFGLLMLAAHSEAILAVTFVAKRLGEVTQ
jgi:hypothetical protein